MRVIVLRFNFSCLKSNYLLRFPNEVRSAANKAFLLIFGIKKDFKLSIASGTRNQANVAINTKLS